MTSRNGTAPFRTICRSLCRHLTHLITCSALQTPRATAARSSDCPRPSTPYDVACAGAGERAARARLTHWLSSHAADYKKTFRRLRGDYSSRLGPAIAHGAVDVAEVAQRIYRDVPAGPSREHLMYELCWREFCCVSSQKWWAVLAEARARAEGAVPTEASERWKRGVTGIPIVDAGMRELAQTGYCGNLARQIVAAYLVHDLGVDWAVGAAHFEACLVDYDPCINWCQWARTAGIMMATEAKQGRVGSHRYIDIALRHPHNEAELYVLDWVPELRGSGGDVLAPWVHGTPPHGYPSPDDGPTAQHMAQVRAKKKRR
eukprot:TRINITY_DN14859_c0_g1_i2.p1 TRINITY_DN14859_c0_g1~~TRINITY_DN14859_c0_g1_i2.p1  ORF type:complete len:317 (+),score=34.22 TRINITY_DN14859_c0_g1_i2:465-1415(+)